MSRYSKHRAQTDEEVTGRATSQTQQRALVGNAALVREVLSQVAVPAVCDAIFEAALSEGDAPEWTDVGSIFAFVGGAFTSAVRDALGDSAASAVCEDALAILMKQGQWADDLLPQEEEAPAAPAAPSSGGAPRSAGRRTKRATSPYLALGNDEASGASRKVGKPVALIEEVPPKRTLTKPAMKKTSTERRSKSGSTLRPGKPKPE